MTVLGIDTANIEKTINSLNNVISCKVIVDDGKISEVHVLADDSRNPKQISRDVQSAVMAGFDMELDHKKISVAQVDLQHDLVKNSRPKIKRVGISSEGNKIEVVVELWDRGDVYESRASGYNTQRVLQRLLAEATLDCINDIVKMESRFVLEGIRKIRLVEEDIYVVGISQMGPMQEIFLSGTSVVQSDEKRSVVKAVLDAINRKVGNCN
ncbi:MAG: hypothetical protein JJE29_07240 [Peptostreptococcaceae bacterium]|nr:hypothetical protein [Peptostreptococcaceae bacterium]